MTTFTRTVEYDPASDNHYIELGEELTSSLGWGHGDTLEWKDNGDGSFSLTKKEEIESEMEWVMVDTIQTFHHRYCVQVPKGKTYWALDIVDMQDAEEFSQNDLGETIVTHRAISKEEALVLCDQANSYCQDWTEEQKLNAFFTPYKE